MKKLLLSILCLISINAYSYSLSYVDTIEAKEYNDVWGQYFNKDIKIYAGSNGDVSTVRFKYDMTLGEYDIDYVFDGSQASSSRVYMDLYNNLAKAQEWSKIARENSAETNKTIGDCSTYTTYCTVSFKSTNGGKNTSAMLKIEEKGDFTFNEGTFMIPSRELTKLVNLLQPDKMTLGLTLSAKKNNQADDLFN
tara:strand:- start:1115 stop:1696 length:582 start_codon:yes stop_codon:yes gene_type:complete